MLKKICLLLLLSGLLFTQKIKASHMIGGEISFQSTTTSGVFTVTMVLYRDCSSIGICACPLVTSCSKSMVVYGMDSIWNGVNLVNLTATIDTSLSGYDIVSTCSNVKSISTNCGRTTPGSFSPGIEKYVFKATLNTNAFNTYCCRVRATFTECCRSNAITTGSASNMFFIYGILNRCISPNNSPVFYNATSTVVYNGQDFYYNPAAVDPDGDSLTYEIDSAVQDLTTRITYNSPYTWANPFPFLGTPTTSLPPPSGIQFHINKGDFRARPTGNFVTVLLLSVKKWRKINNIPTVIGVVRRDIQLYSIAPSSTNISPTLRTPGQSNLYTFDYATMAGKQTCFAIWAHDSISADTTDLTFLNATQTLQPLGATSTSYYPYSSYANRLSAGKLLDSTRFCWTPGSSTVRSMPHYLYVAATDRACPVHQRSTRAFGITVSGAGTFASQPTTAASNLVYSNRTPTSMTVSFTKGNGAKRMLIIYTNSSSNPIATDTTEWYANANYGSGGEVVSGTYVVYADTGNMVNITGLTNNTLYYFRVFEYNGSGLAANYLTTSFLSGSTVLPVKLLSFDAKLVDENTVKLNWATASEVRANYFEIERANTNRQLAIGTGPEVESQWLKLGKVKAAGNSNSIQNYQFTDASFLSTTGTIYYRLRIIDNDASYDYSKTVSVDFSSTTAGKSEDMIEFYPNPFTKDITLKINSSANGQVKIDVKDVSGKTVTDENIGYNKGITLHNFVSLTNLKPGVYFVSLVINEKQIIQKLIKQ